MPSTHPARHLLRTKDLAGSFQPRVPPVIRGEPAPVPADATAGAGRCAAPQHRPHGRRICLMAGFTSVGSFTTRFGRTFGLSPTAYPSACLPAAGANPGLRAARLGAPARSDSTFGEDEPRRAALGW
jgi:AraC-like DNA-binding protein